MASDADSGSEGRARTRDHERTNWRSFCCFHRPLRYLAYTVHVLDLCLGIALSVYGIYVVAKCLLMRTQQTVPTAAVCCSAIFGAAMLLSASCPLDSTSRCGRRCLSLSTCLSPLILTSEVVAFVILLVRAKDIFSYLTLHGDALGLARNMIQWLNDHYGAISSLFLFMGLLELCRFIVLLRMRRRLSVVNSGRPHRDEELERRRPLLDWRRRQRSLVESADVNEIEDEDTGSELPFEERHQILRSLQDVSPGERAEGEDSGGFFCGGFRFWNISRFLGGDVEDARARSIHQSLDGPDDAVVGFAPVDQDLKTIGPADASNWWSLYEGGKDEKDMESSDDGRGLV